MCENKFKINLSINLNKENKSKLEALLEKVANERDLEVCGLNIQKHRIKKIWIKLINLILRYFI